MKPCALHPMRNPHSLRQRKLFVSKIESLIYARPNTNENLIFFACRLSLCSAAISQGSKILRHYFGITDRTMMTIRRQREYGTEMQSP